MNVERLSRLITHLSHAYRRLWCHFQQILNYIVTIRLHLEGQPGQVNNVNNRYVLSNINILDRYQGRELTSHYFFIFCNQFVHHCQFLTSLTQHALPFLIIIFWLRSSLKYNIRGNGAKITIRMDIKSQYEWT